MAELFTGETGEPGETGETGETGDPTWKDKNMIRDKKLLKRLRVKAAASVRQPRKRPKSRLDQVRVEARVKGEPHSPPTIDEKAYLRPEDLTIEGATSPTGVPCVLTADGASGKEVWIPLEDFSDDARPAKAKRKKGGLFLFNEAEKAWIEKVRKLESFPPRPLLDHPGWTGPHFALPSGEVFSPSGEVEQVVLFDCDPGKCARRGKLKDWKAGVAKLAAGQDIVTFALMLAFVGALLRLSRIQYNFGFELVGSKGVGKSIVQQLVASVFGGAVESEGRNFWLSANTTMNGLEELMPQHADQVMIVEEMSLFCAGETDRNRATKLIDLVFRLASGTIKARYQNEKQQPIRFVYLTSSNEPLSGLLRYRQSHTAEAAADRLLTIPIDGDRKHGIFTKLPEGCKSSDEAARAIVNLIANHHGLAIRRFLKRLVREVAADEDGLKGRIDGDIKRFRDAVGTGGNVGSEARVADVIGLVFAAGQLAKRYGALPENLSCLRAAKECHRLNRRDSGPPPSPLEELRALSVCKEVFTVDPANLQKISDKRLGSAPALLRLIGKGRVELLLTKEALKRAFPNWRALLKDPGIKAIMRPDKDKPTIKRTVRSNKSQERFYCFELPANGE